MKVNQISISAREKVFTGINLNTCLMCVHRWLGFNVVIIDSIGCSCLSTGKSYAHAYLPIKIDQILIPAQEKLFTKIN